MISIWSGCVSLKKLRGVRDAGHGVYKMFLLLSRVFIAALRRAW